MLHSFAYLGSNEQTGFSVFHSVHPSLCTNFPVQSYYEVMSALFNQSEISSHPINHNTDFNDEIIEQLYVLVIFVKPLSVGNEYHLLSF